MLNVQSMKLGVVCPVIVIALLCAMPRCQAAPPFESTSEASPQPVAANYADINDAIISHDLDKIMSFFTNDFTEVNSSGAVVDRDQERKEYQSQLSKIKSMEIHYSIESCVPTAEGTYYDVRFHMDGVGFKKVLFMKIQGTFTNDLMVHDLWVSTPDGWRLKTRQCLLDETKVAAD